MLACIRTRPTARSSGYTECTPRLRIDFYARTTAVVDRFNAVRVSTLRVELIFVDQGMSLDPTRRPPTEAVLDTDDHERNWLGCSHILCRRLGWRCRWVVAHLPLDCTCMAWARQWI